MTPDDNTFLNKDITVEEYIKTFEIKSDINRFNTSDSSSGSSGSEDDEEMKTKLIEYIKDNSLREVLLLLKGENGPMGPQGISGPPGKRGKRGYTGYPPVSVLRELIREEIMNLKHEGLLN